MFCSFASAAFFLAFRPIWSDQLLWTICWMLEFNGGQHLLSKWGITEYSFFFFFFFLNLLILKFFFLCNSSINNYYFAGYTRCRGGIIAYFSGCACRGNCYICFGLHLVALWLSCSPYMGFHTVPFFFLLCFGTLLYWDYIGFLTFNSEALTGVMNSLSRFIVYSPCFLGIGRK